MLQMCTVYNRCSYLKYSSYYAYVNMCVLIYVNVYADELGDYGVTCYANFLQ